MNQLLDKTHKKLILEFFTEQAEVWKKVYDPESSSITLYYREFMQKRRDIVLNVLDGYFGGEVGRVLDAGCGAGSFVLEVSKRGHDCIGMDITDEMLKMATATLKYSDNGCSSSLLKGSIENIPLESGSVDVALCVGVLEYVEDLNAAISELIRVIQPEGILIVTFPNLLKLGHMVDPYYYLIRLPAFLQAQRENNGRMKINACRNTDVGRNDDFICKRFTSGTLEKMFRKYDLKIVVRENVCYGPLTFWHRDLLGPERVVKLSAALCRLSKKKNFGWLGHFADRWVFALKKNTSNLGQKV
jgi:ubiquinone/menaquinone biosynthesis C-methylase UbiE